MRGCGPILVVLALLLMGCGEDANVEEPWVWNLPQGFPVPVVPADNPMTVAKVELGRQLFFDPILSLSRNQSCGSCHEPARAFTDGRALSEGSTGELTRRNSMSLANVAYNATLNWADPNMTRLEEQARGPLFGTEPVELGMGGREVELLDRLRDDPEYAEAFPLAFPNGEAFTVERLLAALASYQRSLISGGSPYDRFIAGDSELSEAARRGLELFFGERFECFHCHGGFNFTQSNRHEGAPDGEAPFHNTGLYNVDGRGAYPERDQGLIEVTGQPEDMGRFRAPTLRNVMVTAPYMHDGSVATIDEALDHYARGGRRISEGPNQGDGRLSIVKSDFVSGFQMTPEEREDLKAFLRSLTDDSFLSVTAP